MNEKSFKPKVLVAYKDYASDGGAEKNLIEVSEYMSQHFDIVFIVTSADNPERLEDIGRVYYYPSKGKKVLFMLDIIYMGWLIQKEKISLVHSHHRYPVFISSFVNRFVKCKTLTTVHNVFPDKTGLSLWGDRLIAVSHAVERWLVDKCEQSRADIKVIHNGISDVETFPDHEIRRIRTDLKIPEQHILLCAIGRLSEQKNYPMLFNVLTQIEHKKWSLLLIGDGEDADQLRVLAHELGIENHIRFMGVRSDINLLLQCSDIYVMSSSWEGFPYVIVEALANGLAVVSTDVGGVSEAVKDGENGFLSPIGDEAEFNHSLNKLLHSKSERDAMGESGRRIFEDRFTKDKMCKSTLRQYEILLNQ